MTSSGSPTDFAVKAEFSAQRLLQNFWPFAWIFQKAVGPPQ
jgi:hypothetical protein